MSDILFDILLSEVIHAPYPDGQEHDPEKFKHLVTTFRIVSGSNEVDEQSNHSEELESEEQV